MVDILLAVGLVLLLSFGIGAVLFGFFEIGKDVILSLVRLAALKHVRVLLRAVREDAEGVKILVSQGARAASDGNMAMFYMSPFIVYGQLGKEQVGFVSEEAAVLALFEPGRRTHSWDIICSTYEVLSILGNFKWDLVAYRYLRKLTEMAKLDPWRKTELAKAAEAVKNLPNVNSKGEVKP